MAVVVEDPFTEASDTTLASHTPNTTGTGWTLQEQINTAHLLEVVAASDRVLKDTVGNELGARLTYTSDPDPTEADVDVEITIVIRANSGDDPLCLIARYTDASNWYSAGTYRESATADKKIFKNVGGTITELASGDSGLADGDTIKFELRGTTLKLFKNGGEELSVTDSSHTGAGKAGFSEGNFWVSTDDINDKWELDDYKVTEFGAGIPSLVMAPYVPAER